MVTKHTSIMSLSNHGYKFNWLKSKKLGQKTIWHRLRNKSNSRPRLRILKSTIWSLISMQQTGNFQRQGKYLPLSCCSCSHLAKWLASGSAVSSRPPFSSLQLTPNSPSRVSSQAVASSARLVVSTLTCLSFFQVCWQV